LNGTTTVTTETREIHHVQERETREREEEEEEKLIIARKERVKEENKVCSMVEASEQRAYIFPAGVRFSIQATGFVHAIPTSLIRSCCYAYDLQYVFCSL
jgi:hypothetical protein